MILIHFILIILNILHVVTGSIGVIITYICIGYYAYYNVFNKVRVVCETFIE